MEWSWSFLLYSVIIVSLITFLFNYLHRKKFTSNRLPPGPPGWPVIGHMFNLGSMPHRTLAGLGKQYGPVVWLRLGSIDTMVVLTGKASTEFFKNHDPSFADRNFPTVLESHNYNKGSLALAPYGPYWRFLRRVCTIEVLATKRINETILIRRKCVDDMLSWIEKEVVTPKVCAIHVAQFVFLAAFNMLGKLVFSRELADPFSEEGSEFFLATNEFMKISGEPNIADLFPWLRWLDPQGLKRKMDCELGKILSIISGYVKERIIEQGDSGERSNKDFLDVLLNFEGIGKDEPSRLIEEQISIFILEMFLAGTETTSSTIEWAMTELLRHPEKMIKLKAELEEVIGLEKKMEERDIDHLQYLQAVIKETMRLHPPVPLSIPRKAIKDTEFMGYDIPKDTQVFVNSWAIGRDPECWDEPDSFKPERFLGSAIDYKGKHFELIPFGAGRRMCAGVLLGHRMLHLFLASLIHEFDWELEDHVNRETMDMTEQMGTAVSKKEPLEAIPKKRKVKHST